MIKLNPNERLLIENGVNQYKVLGPGLVWLMPWQTVLTRLSVAPQEQTLRFEAVRTGEEVPVEVKVQVLYRVDPALFNDDLLPKIPALAAGGWPGIVQWRTEVVLRSLLAGYTWRSLGLQASQQRLEHCLAQTLADCLKGVGLSISAVYLIKTELPINLQKVLIQVERNVVEAEGRAAALKVYASLFGPDLNQAMPQIMQWEWLNLLCKNGQSSVVLSGLPFQFLPVEATRGIQPVFQMELPSAQVGDTLKSH